MIVGIELVLSPQVVQNSFLVVNVEELRNIHVFDGPYFRKELFVVLNQCSLVAF